MKNIILKTFLFCTLVISFFSCSKKIDDVYQNPNAPVRVPVEELLPNIIASMAGNYAGHGPMNDIRYIGAYVQSFQFYLPLSNYDEMGYTNNASDIGQSTWRMHYYDIGQNNMQMMAWAAEEKKWDYVGVGKAIAAWSWLTLTDYYGDVILKEAFQTEKITFKYDTQEDVYNYVRQLCFEALDNLNKTGDAVSQANLAKGDAFFYNGDVAKWKKFVYGILARYHNHLSNKSIYKADSVIYYGNLSMANNNDNAVVKFTANSLSATNNFFGPFRGNLTGTGVTNPTAIRQGAYIANLVNGTNTEFAGVQDPRGWYILRGNTNGTIKGLDPNKGQAVMAANDRPENFWGVSQSGTASNTAPANDLNCRYLFRNSAPFPVMTASEVKFMIAEAAFRKGDKALAYQAYQDGISLNFDMLSSTYNVNIPTGKDINAINKNTYMTNTAVVPATSAGLTMSKIMLQKYIAMFAWGTLETWADMRRFHYIDSYGGQQVYTNFVVPSGGDLFPDNATKLVYRVRPRFNSEYVWNILELQRIGATNNDYHTVKMWFTEP
ncbi:SusD/RagB family nutrient-binding outer membrane lipoprotein [Ferruginibacter sp. SUN106]|uniref:SusD/RagB family nutrient-binding outer membrane lipoprotein n=1 Tax=Ferruginibacter sp. SUN106 TaxID=2978348 RepID=UPI003D36E2B7